MSRKLAKTELIQTINPHQHSKFSSFMPFQIIIKLGKFLKALEEDSKMYVFLPMGTDVRDYLIVLVHTV